MNGIGTRYTNLFGKPYIWVRKDDGKLTLKRIVEADFQESLEEHFERLGLDPTVLNALKAVGE